MMKDPAAMTVTIVKNNTKKAEETMGVEERKSLSAISMERIKAIGQTNAPSPLRRKKSSIGRILSQQSQSIIPHSCSSNLRRRPPLGLRHQIGRYHIWFTTTTRCRTHIRCHLRNNQCQCYPLLNTIRHGRGTPHHSIMTQQVCLHLRSLNQVRYLKELATSPLVAWSTSSTPSPEDPTNQCTRRRDNAKNTSELSLM